MRIATAVLLLGATFVHAASRACSPPPPGTKGETLVEMVARSDEVVLAKVDWKEKSEQPPYSAKATVTVVRRFKTKGLPVSRIETYDASACGLGDFELGQLYVLFLSHKRTHESEYLVFRSDAFAGEEAQRVVVQLQKLN